MDSSKHTPTPWTLDTGETIVMDANRRIIADAFGLDFATCTDRANAALIVRAVNSHDQLVAALRRLIASNEAYSAVHASDGDDVARMIEWADAFDDASALVAKIEA